MSVGKPEDHPHPKGRGKPGAANEYIMPCYCKETTRPVWICPVCGGMAVRGGMWPSAPRAAALACPGRSKRGAVQPASPGR